MNSVNFNRMLRFFLVVSIAVSSIISLYFVAKYTYPFIFAVILALLINPLVNLLQQKGNIARPLAVFLSICLVLAIIVGTVTLLIVEIISGTTYLAEQTPKHFRDLVTFFEEFISNQVIPAYQQLASLFHMLNTSHQTAVLNNIQRIGEDISSQGAMFIQRLLQQIPIALGNLPNYITVLLFSLLGTFFISKDWYKFKKTLQQITPKPISNSSTNVFTSLKKALVGFIKAQITLISITAGIVLVGLVILKVDHAITIAFITGLVDLFPYLGTGIIFLPWILYTFFTGNYFLSIGLSMLYITVVVQRQLMEPKVLSTNIGLHPLATLIALFVGFQLWGLAGLIIAPISVVIINTFIQTGVIDQLWSYIKGEE